MWILQWGEVSTGVVYYQSGCQSSLFNYMRTMTAPPSPFCSGSRTNINILIANNLIGYSPSKGMKPYGQIQLLPYDLNKIKQILEILTECKPF